MLANKTLKIFVDGSCRGNGSKKAIGGVGIVIYENKRKIANLNYLLSFPVTNNEAEYYALIYALEFLSIGCEYRRKLLVYSDSKLIVEQINMRWKITQENLRCLWVCARQNLYKYDSWKVMWIPRSQNTEADTLAQTITKE